MTTDITELAQREKFEAWLSEKPFHARYMHWSNTLNAYDYTSIQLAWEAYQAGCAELVEALEKMRQEHNVHEVRLIEQRATLKEYRLYTMRLNEERRLLKERIAELEGRSVKLTGVNHDQI
ncbi:TPA: hypothetical protein M6A06_004008 [Klebsiella pneumoniae]|nr:hypothetical protein [Klebsiella pneumoniae]